MKKLLSSRKRVILSKLFHLRNIKLKTKQKIEYNSHICLTTPQPLTIKKMENLRDLQKFVWNLGWFSKSVKLTITLESEFEGYYGRASEGWEKQVIIQIESPDETICPNIKVIGQRFDDIDKVSFLVLQKIETWRSSLK